jgi:predicted DNA-binding antitoxin AbrB/MazE fold protein
MVQVNIKPWGAIVVDGVLKGVSPPLKKLQLAEGKHQIKIENPNFRSQTIEINITNKNTGVIEHDFSANKK